jgi:hypothetical protein
MATKFETYAALASGESVVLTNTYDGNEVALHVARDGYNTTYFMTLTGSEDGSNRPITTELAMALIENDTYAS